MTMTTKAGVKREDELVMRKSTTNKKDEDNNGNDYVAGSAQSS